jgi:hypothetical protein
MLIRPALVSAAAAALAIVPLTSAGAATYRHPDAAHDISTVDIDVNAADPNLTFTPAPDATEPDVLSLKVVHGLRQVTATMQLADLSKTSDLNEYGLELRTNDRRTYIADLMASPKHWNGRATFSAARGSASCKQMTHSIDYAANRVTIDVPRSCLGRPRWVQAAALAVDETVTTTTSPDGSQSTTIVTAYADDAQSPTFRQRETWSPRIRRG